LPAEPTGSSQLSQPWWQDRFAEKQVEMHRQPVRLVFFGDSITHSFEWNTEYSRVWDHWYGGRNAVDLGFNSDRTADVIWRVRHGELDGASPALAVILIGTNDLAKPPAEIAASIEQLARDVRDRSASTRILILGILPSGRPEAELSIGREVNALLSAHFSHRGAIASYRDVSCTFLREGRLDTSLFNEKAVPGQVYPLHPTPRGMDALAAAIEPVVAAALGDKIRKPLFTTEPVCQAAPSG
jgi:lysophospholipase L1-like esterase